jgi:hypothetical protein
MEELPNCASDMDIEIYWGEMWKLFDFISIVCLNN